MLPERVYNIRVHVPYSVHRHGNTFHKTYLDTVGRPVLSLSKKNIIETHIQEFELEYMLNPALLIMEPLITAVVFYMFFVLVIVYRRLDLSITRPRENERERKRRQD